MSLYSIAKEMKISHMYSLHMYIKGAKKDRVSRIFCARESVYSVLRKEYFFLVDV
jgi:hypothetical protein